MNTRFLAWICGTASIFFTDVANAKIEPTCSIRSTGHQAVIWYAGEQRISGEICNNKKSDCGSVSAFSGATTVSIDFEQNEFPLIFSGQVIEKEEGRMKKKSFRPKVICLTDREKSGFLETIQTSVPAMVTGFFAILAGLILTWFSSLLHNRHQREIAIQEWVADYKFQLESFARLDCDSPLPPKSPALDRRGMEQMSLLQNSIRSKIAEGAIPADISGRKALVALIKQAIDN